MAEPAAKKGDIIKSDGKGQVWVQPTGSTSPISAVFSYEGPIDNGLSSNVLIMGKPAAILGSTSTNSTPPASQVAVTGQGSILTQNIDDKATISTASSNVLINGKKAARNGDKAMTWDYSSGPPGIGTQKENASVQADGTVLIGG